VPETTKGRIKQSPKRPAEERRRELLEAALNLFMKKGVRETSMDEISRKAGLTKGALYFHFSSKDDLFFELVKSLHESIIAQIRELPAHKSSPTDVLSILVECQHGHGAAPFERFLDFWLQASKVPAIRKFLGTGISSGFHKVFEEVIDPAYAATPRARRDLGVMVMVAAEGLGVRQLMGDPDINLGRQLKMFDRFLGTMKK
jgi:AcrR family transcriptional regulator